MVSISVVLTPLHYVYLAGVVSILAVMAFKKDTPAVCIAFLFLAGVTGLGSFSQGVMTVFRGILYAAREFMEVIAVISLVTALSLCLKELGSHRLMMVPMSRVMKTPTAAWWILGLSMLLFSLFLWPSPSAALLGAVMLPFALKAGLHPLMAAMAMNLFGHGMALSFDFIIQGAPGISAAAAGIPPAQILSKGAPCVSLHVGSHGGRGFFLKPKRNYRWRKWRRCRRESSFARQQRSFRKKHLCPPLSLAYTRSLLRRHCTPFNPKTFRRRGHQPGGRHSHSLNLSGCHPGL